MRRFLQAVLLLVIVSVIIFCLLHAVPGGPLAIYLENPNVRPEDIERLKHSLGLDRSLVAQYVTWLGGVVRGGGGSSLCDGRRVTGRPVERVPATLELVGRSRVGALIAVVPVGVL